MKKYAFLNICILAILALGACSDTDNITNVPNINGQPEQNVTAGQIHTEFLSELYSDKSYTTTEKNLDTDHIAIETAKRICAKHGITPPADEVLLAAINEGRQKATQDPIQLVRQTLNQDEYLWWDRFASEAKMKNAETVYQNHCRLYGAPQAGSMLESVVDIALSSADFWDNYRGATPPKYHNPYVPMEKSWKNFLRFAVSVVVDGTCGGLAGAGTGWSGPGAAVVGGVVGGLASAGADNMLFD